MKRQRVLIAILALVVLAGGAAFLVTRSSSGEDIYLEGAGDIGANPFTTIAVRQCADGFEPDATGACVPATTSSSSSSSSSTSIADTTTTALYGGSGNQKKCDPEALIAYLTSHPDKAAAWVQGLNEDPTLSWSGGNKVTVADIPTFIRELTPTFLTQDTRVTNHGYFNGKATPHQSVLQKGTAVLVDRTGVPRTRCACGNPLGRPHKVDHPHYKGTCWDGCHDQPYCAPPGCFDTTTSTAPTTTSTTCVTQPPGKPSTNVQVAPTTAPCGPTTTERTTTTTLKRGSGTTTTHAPTTTTTRATTTTTTLAPTTTTTPSTTSTTQCVIGTVGCPGKP